MAAKEQEIVEWLNKNKNVGKEMYNDDIIGAVVNNVIMKMEYIEIIDK